MEQRAHGFGVREEPLVAMRVPDIYNLRSDPFERAKEDAQMFYSKWKADRAFLLVPAQQIVGEFLQTFKEFPPPTGVLVSRYHTSPDLILPIDAQEKEMLDAVDGRRSIAAIVDGAGGDRTLRARAFFEKLFRYDQVVFDSSNAA